MAYVSAGVLCLGACVAIPLLCELRRAVRDSQRKALLLADAPHLVGESATPAADTAAGAR
jgi:hypothetical protein